MTMPGQNYQFIKEWLQSGEIAKLAKDSGLTPDCAYKRLRGDVKDHSFVTKCYSVALQRANEVLTMRQNLSELRNKIESL